MEFSLRILAYYAKNAEFVETSCGAIAASSIEGAGVQNFATALWIGCCIFGDGVAHSLCEPVAGGYGRRWLAERTPGVGA